MSDTAASPTPKAPKPAAPKTMEYEVAPGHGLFIGSGDKAVEGDIIALTAKEFKTFPKGSLLPYVEPED